MINNVLTVALIFYIVFSGIIAFKYVKSKQTESFKVNGKHITNTRQLKKKKMNAVLEKKRENEKPWPPTT